MWLMTRLMRAFNKWIGVESPSHDSAVPSDEPPVPESSVNAQLVTVLDEIVALLEEYDEEHWARLMRESRQAVANGSGGFRSVLSRYGGMGSFNDLIIAQHLTGEDMARPNDRLYALRSQAYDLAVQARLEYRA